MDKIDKKLNHKPISIAEFGLNKQIIPIAIPIDVRLSELFLKHNDIRYIIIIIPALTLDGVSPATKIKSSTKNMVNM